MVSDSLIRTGISRIYNSYALLPLNGTAISDGTTRPLPTALQYSPFPQRINNTPSQPHYPVPILDPESDSSTPLNSGQIASIVIGFIAGAILLGVAIFFLTKKVMHKRKQMELERNNPKAVIDDAPDIHHTKVETGGTVSDKDGSSSLSPPAYAADNRLSASQTPLLSPPSSLTPLPESKDMAPSFPTPYPDSRDGEESTHSSQQMSARLDMVRDFELHYNIISYEIQDTSLCMFLG
jgi:hypothetical protein